MKNHSDNTKEKITAAARRQFSSVGYQGTSMVKIAKAVGVKKSSLYYFFSSKADLFLHVLRGVIREQKNIFAVSVDDERPSKTLKKVIEKSVTRGLEAGQILYVPHTVSESASENVLKKIKQESCAMKKVLSDLCEDSGIAEPGQAAHVIADSGRGYLMRRELGEEGLSPREYADKITRLLIQDDSDY